MTWNSISMGITRPFSMLMHDSLLFVTIIGNFHIIRILFPMMPRTAFVIHQSKMIPSIGYRLVINPTSANSSYPVIALYSLSTRIASLSLKLNSNCTRSTSSLRIINILISLRVNHSIIHVQSNCSLHSTSITSSYALFNYLLNLLNLLLLHGITPIIFIPAL